MGRTGIQQKQVLEQLSLTPFPVSPVFFRNLPGITPQVPHLYCRPARVPLHLYHQIELRMSINNTPDHNRRKLLFTGIFILSIGLVWLLQKTGAIDLPDYIFSWKTMLIGIGIIGGIQFRFRGFTWLVPALVGIFFLLGDIPGIHFSATEYALPFLILTLGLWFVLTALWKRRLIGNYEDWSDRKGIVSNTERDDMVELTSIFGGNKKKVFSKRFRGGEVTNIFGGTELDLAQADIEGTVILDSTNIFGGMTIIAPSNWNIQLESTCILGGVDDKREQKDGAEIADKKLVITGVCFCGGIEIKSY